MQPSDYIDKIERVTSYLEKQEQDCLFSMLDNIEELYISRRATRSEQVFWNQFWHAWDFPNLRDARQQALEDIAADEYFHNIRENHFGYKNFEKAVAIDVLRYRLQILLNLGSDFEDLRQKIFYNLQNQVQQFLGSNDLTPIIKDRLDVNSPIILNVSERADITQSSKNEGTTETEAYKLKNKSKKSKRLKKEIKIQRHKESNENTHKWPEFYRLQIQTPKGNFIELGNSNDTFLEFVKRVGYRKVRDLGIIFEDEPIFSDTPKNGGWKEVTKDVYLCCRMNCELKIKYVNFICESLGKAYKPSKIKQIN